ncbi:hypothetical protein WMY93_005677 [Mugilogobius chulae]|uniref:Reverse transcriptase n=1 Tax=Mugilogobius chulae TaxID=88201 RepID=A0AAW0PRD3_9GOBI
MELIIRASSWVVGGERLESGLRLPPIRAYMDDMTTITNTKPCTKRLLDKLQSNIKWAGMKIKPSKSRSISIVKGQLVSETFFVSEEPIPTILEKPIKSLGRWYNATLNDTEQIEQIRQDTIRGLKQINNTALPGKLKLWCFHFGLMPRLLWPLTIYEFTSSHVNRLERLVNAQIRKWLGLPKCMSSVGLYVDGPLSLPLSNLTEEYRCAKARLEMTLTESQDPCVRGAAPVLRTGNKWTPKAAVTDAKATLRHRDIMGHVQQGRGGFGLGVMTPLWESASSAERRHMVVEEVRRQEEAARCAKAVSQAQQGRWMRWDGIAKKKISWSELWNMESNRLSFVIRATYDILPSPTNLSLWLGEDSACPLCSAPANLKHILVGCKTSLSQGRYTWRHNQVLRCLASAIEQKRTVINATSPKKRRMFQNPIAFVQEGKKHTAKGPPAMLRPIEAANDWEMRVDLDKSLAFPPNIASTRLRPDLVLWSNSSHKVFIVELTVPWEEAIDEAYERKKLRYSQLAAEAEERGWSVLVYPVEVGCRGFVANSTIRLLKEGRGGFGLGVMTPLWESASSAERRHMVVEEVRRQEEAARCAKAVSQAQQGRWMRWDGIAKKKISWSELWNMESNRLSFIIRATYDILPSPTNLSLWLGEDSACPLCSAPANLKHILVGCKTSLSQGRYTWRHNQVLRCLASAIEQKRTVINATSPKKRRMLQNPIAFVQEGKKHTAKGPPAMLRPIEAANDWEMRVDLDKSLAFPPNIVSTRLRPDLVLWSNSSRKVFIVELTVPWEEAIDEAYERKKLRYSQLAAEAEERGWSVLVYPVEVGCRGFVANSTIRLLKEVGITGRAQKKLIKELATSAEKSSHWLWLRRKEIAWGAK